MTQSYFVWRNENSECPDWWRAAIYSARDKMKLPEDLDLLAVGEWLQTARDIGWPCLRRQVPVRLTGHGLSRLREWAATLPGYSDETPPFMSELDPSNGMKPLHEWMQSEEDREQRGAK